MKYINMDIVMHLFLVILIGIFFFINKYSNTHNPMYIVILISFFGFIFLLGDPSIELYNYNSVIENPTGTFTHSSTDISGIGLGLFNVLSFTVLIYTFFFMVALLNVIYDGRKDGK